MSHIDRRHHALSLDPNYENGLTYMSVKEENNAMDPDCLIYRQPKYFGFLSKSNIEYVVLKMRKDPTRYKFPTDGKLLDRMQAYAIKFSKNVDSDPANVNWMEVCDHMNRDFLANVIESSLHHDTNPFREIRKNADGDMVKYKDMGVEDFRQLDVWAETKSSVDPSKYRNNNKIPFRQTIGSKRNYERYHEPFLTANNADDDVGSLQYERTEQVNKRTDMSGLRAFKK